MRAPLRLAVSGATGRMGRTIIRLCQEAGDIDLVGATAAPGDPHVGEDAGTQAGARTAGVAESFDLTEQDRDFLRSLSIRPDPR